MLEDDILCGKRGAVTRPPRGCYCVGTRIYVNRPKFHGRGDGSGGHEIGRHGRYTKALSVGDFEKRYLSLTRVEKTPEGWIAPTESYVFQGVCPSTTRRSISIALDIGVISAARNADASITFCVLDDDGQQRELSESELGQALGMYELYENHMAKATAANEMAMAGMSL
ncbi:hypothetical protein JL720_8555 [Aureococcus anophagefferens]|nr:hypothetical protein JL720_8555 [Aureococcus anophagefferens]